MNPGTCREAVTLPPQPLSFNLVVTTIEMATYTPGEYVDMIITYGIAEENSNDAARIYAERFPDRDQHPDSKTILRCVKRAKETGDLRVSERENADADEERILREFKEHPNSSVRGVAEKLGVSRYMVHRIIRQNRIRPSAE